VQDLDHFLSLFSQYLFVLVYRVYHAIESKLLWKTNKVRQFLKKYIWYSIPFLKKDPLKSLYLFVICNITHFQDGNTKVKFMLKNLEEIPVGSESGSGSEILSGSTSLIERKTNLYRSTSERILYRCFLLLLCDISFILFYFVRRWQA
jgi:hypothetical protein